MPYTTLFDYLEALREIASAGEGGVGWPRCVLKFPDLHHPDLAAARVAGRCLLPCCDCIPMPTPAALPCPALPWPALTTSWSLLTLAAAPLGARLMFYLAAAVSDFFLPWSHMVGGLLGADCAAVAAAWFPLSLHSTTLAVVCLIV